MAAAKDITQVKVGTTNYDINALKVTYVTTAPTADNEDNGLKFAVLTSEPTTKYAKWFYIITEA